MAKKIQDGNQIVTNVDSNDNLTFSIKSSFIDSTPTVNSTNLVTSGGVKSALDINTTDIAAAVIRIANNETNISNNTDDIEALEDAVSTNTTNISTNTTDINSLETTVGTLSTNINANTTNIGTLNNLTTTNKTNLVNAINELETDKLETSAVVNEASTDTDKTYSANYLNDKIFTAFEDGTWTKNTTYVRTTGYMNCYKNNRLCYFNGNFRIDTVPTTKGEILFSNLPHPRTRVTTMAMIETTPVRLYIDTDGNLRTDSTNYITGWVNFCCMYVL